MHALKRLFIMITHKDFNIAFKGLKQGKHQFKYKIDETFFTLFEYDEFNTATIDTVVDLNKLSTMMEIHFSASGTVGVPCDLSNELFDMPLKADLELLVKFGEEFNNENEEVLILPHGEYQMNLAQYIYEMIVLAMPSKRIHPGIEDGSLQSDILDRLEDLEPKETETTEDDTDPRWDALKKLLKENDK